MQNQVNSIKLNLKIRHTNSFRKISIRYRIQILKNYSSTFKNVVDIAYG